MGVSRSRVRAPVVMTSEGWLLVTLYFAGPVKRRDPASWRHVIVTADWINHAIISHEEITTGLRALARRGLVVERAGDLLVLSPVARRGFAAACGTRKRMGVFKLWAAAEELIAKQPTRASRARGPSASVVRRAAESYGVTLPSSRRPPSSSPLLPVAPSD